MHKKLLYLIVALLWTFLVSILSLITISRDIGSSLKIPNKDKIVHFVFYFVFVVLWYRYLATTDYTKKVRVIILLSAIGYGILIEICQGMFTVSRTADVFDVVANSFGAFIAFILTILFNRNKKTTR